MVKHESRYARDPNLPKSVTAFHHGETTFIYPAPFGQYVRHTTTATDARKAQQTKIAGWETVTRAEDDE